MRTEDHIDHLMGQMVDTALPEAEGCVELQKSSRAGTPEVQQTALPGD